jgi:hypothetical protein
MITETLINELSATKAKLDELRKQDTKHIFVMGKTGAKYPLSRELDIASDQIADCLMIAKEYYEGRHDQ